MSYSDLTTILLIIGCMTDTFYSTVSPTDYEAVSKTVIFAPCDSQLCVNLINEPEETFTINLSLPGDAPSFIILTSATGEILISDDDGEH